MKAKSFEESIPYIWELLASQSNMKYPQTLKLATDTSSLILLQKSNLLPIAAESFYLYCSPWVWQELLNNATADAVRQFESAVTVVDIHKNTPYLNADGSCVALYVEQDCHAVLADDGKILKRCKKQDIPHYCCLSLLSVLLHQRALSQPQVMFYFDRLLHLGRYSAWVIQTAKEMINRAI